MENRCKSECDRCGLLITPQYPDGYFGQQMDYHGWVCPGSVGSFNFGQFYWRIEDEVDVRPLKESLFRVVCLSCWKEVDGLFPASERHCMLCPQCKEVASAPIYKGCGALSPGGIEGEHRFHLWGWKLCEAHWKVCWSWLNRIKEGRIVTKKLPELDVIVEAIDSNGDWKDFKSLGPEPSFDPLHSIHAFHGQFVGGETPLLHTGSEHTKGVRRYYDYEEQLCWRYKK